MPYLTPETAPGATLCRVLLIPDDDEGKWLAIVTGAIEELSFAYNWEQYGAVTPQQAADRAFAMLNDFMDTQGACRMIGEIIPFAGPSSPLPSLWLMCNGQSLPRADYPDLFAVIGTAYGSDDLAHFSIPDLRGKTLIHQGAGYTLAVPVGESEHTLITSEIPSHNHSVTGHVHTTGNSLTGVALTPGELPVLLPNPIPALTGTGYEGINNTGGDGAHNNVQPSMPISYLIVAKDRA